MSWAVEKWLADNCEVAHLGQRFLLFSMANQASDDGRLLAKNTTFMKRLRVSERTVQRWTAALVAAGLIQKIPDYTDEGRQMCNVYRIVMPGAENNARPASKAPSKGRVTRLSPSHPDATVTLPLTELCHPRGDAHAVTPIGNQTENPNGESRTPPTPRAGGIRVQAVFEEFVQTLWRDHGITLSGKGRREAKHRIRAGVTVAELVQRALALRPPVVEEWNPPDAGPLSPAADALEHMLSVPSQMSENSVVTWFRPLIPVSMDPIQRVLVIAFPSRSGQEWCERNYLAEIKRRAHVISLTGVEFWRPGGTITATSEARA